MNHLYHFENPVDYEDFMFMSFYPENEGTHLQIYKNDQFRDWKDHFTYFEGDEMLTILGCMSILRPDTIINNVTEGRPLSISKNCLNLERNRLEVLAAVSIIEASQHKFQDEYNTLSGQNCFDLTCNILLNLRFDHGRFGNSRKNGIQIYNSSTTQSEGFNLNSFLSSIKVTFLFAANCQVPEILSKLNDFGVMKVGYCEMIADDCLIDKIEKAYEIEDCALNLIFCSYLNEFKPSHLKRIKTGL
jgi:hypothetical protein